MSNQVTLTFGGDTKSLDRATQNASKDLDKVGASAKDASGKISDVTGKVKESSGKFRDGHDAVDGMSTVMGGLGIQLPGVAGNITQVTQGMADLVEGGTTPMGIALIVLPLVILAFQKLYEHSKTFRDIIHDVGVVAKKAFEDIQKAVGVVFDWVKKNWPLLLGILTGPIGLAVVEIIKHRDSIFNAIKALPGKIKSALSTVKDAVLAPFKAAFNAVSDAWNNTVGRVSFSIPGWVPKIGGDGFSFPQMPHAANGGFLNGPTLVGERGPEIFTPNGAGGRITPNSSMAKGGSGSTTIQFVVDGRVVTEQVYEGLLRKQRRTGTLGLT